MISKRLFIFLFLIALSAATDDVWTRFTPNLWDDELASVNNDVVPVVRSDQQICLAGLDRCTLPTGAITPRISNWSSRLPTSGCLSVTNASTHTSIDPLYRFMSLQQ